MKLYYHQLGQQLSKEPAPGYWIAGEPWVLNQDAKQQIKAHWLQQGYEATLVPIEQQQDVLTWVDSLRTPTLFQSHRLWLVLVLGQQQLAALISRYLTDVAISAQDKIIIQTMEPHRGQRPAWLHLLTIYPLFKHHIPPWVQSQLKRHHLSATPPIIRHMIAAAQGDLLVLQQMVAKLALCTQGAVQASSLPLLNDSGDGDIKQLESQLLSVDDGAVDLIRLLLKQHIPLPLLLWHLSRFVRVMLCLHTDAAGKDLSSHCGVPAFKLTDYRKAMVTFSQQDWMACLRLCGFADQLIKTAQTDLAQTLISDLFLSMAHRHQAWLQQLMARHSCYKSTY